MFLPAVSPRLLLSWVRFLLKNQLLADPAVRFVLTWTYSLKQISDLAFFQTRPY